jgi:phage terminase small subunit
MIKVCPICKKQFEGNTKKKYCSKKCKKNYENSLRSAPGKKTKKALSGSVRIPSSSINRPHGLNQIATAYWDKIAPTLVARGHLNVLSEDAFAELCDLHSRLKDINMAIDGTNRSLLQIDDKWDNKEGVETKSFKESALSDLKRKYSKQFLEYCKAFYLTPLSNRGNFGIEDETGSEKEKDNLLD